MGIYVQQPLNMSKPIDMHMFDVYNVCLLANLRLSYHTEILT